MKKLLMCVFLIGFLLLSCSKDSTGPENLTGYISDYYLIVVYNDSLLQYFPDTIAQIDSAIAIDKVMEEDSIGAFLPVLYYDTADFTNIVGKGKLILKENLGWTSGEGEESYVVDTGEVLFSVEYPEDIPSIWFGYPTIEIYVTSFDTNHCFHQNIIRATFFSHDFSSEIDSTLKYEIPLYLVKEFDKIKMVATSDITYKL